MRPSCPIEVEQPARPPKGKQQAKLTNVNQQAKPHDVKQQAKQPKVRQPALRKEAVLESRPPRVELPEPTVAKPPVNVVQIKGDLFDQNDLAEFIKRSDIVTKTMHRMQPLGNAVIRIDNLPTKLSINSFNLMMGTYSLVSNQIIGVQGGKRNKEPEKMNVRIIINSGNQDMKRILDKTQSKSAGKSTLFIKRTDLKELETFIHAHYKSLITLQDDNFPTFPSIGIAYGRANNH